MRYDDPRYGTGRRAPNASDLDRMYGARSALEAAATEAIGIPLSTEAIEDPEVELTIADKAGAERLAREVLAIRRNRDAELELPRAEVAAIDEAHAAMVAPIEEFITGVVAKAKAKEDRLILTLKAWHQTQRHEANGKAVNVTIPLPCGVRLTSHKGQETVEVHDEEAAITFLKELALASDTDPTEAPGLRHKPATLELDKRSIKATFKSGAHDGEPGPWVTADGEVIPGLEAKPAVIEYDFDAKGVE